MKKNEMPLCSFDEILAIYAEKEKLWEKQFMTTCGGCGRRYNQAVLSYNPPSEMWLRDALRHDFHFRGEGPACLDLKTLYCPECISRWKQEHPEYEDYSV